MRVYMWSRILKHREAQPRCALSLLLIPRDLGSDVHGNKIPRHKNNYIMVQGRRWRTAHMLGVVAG